MIYARLVRGMVLQLRETPAIQAAQLLGCSTPRILFRHLLPNLYSALLDAGDARARARDARRGVALLPRARRAAARHRLARPDGGREPGLHRERLVDRGLPRPDARADRARDQPASPTGCASQTDPQQRQRRERPVCAAVRLDRTAALRRRARSAGGDPGPAGPLLVVERPRRRASTPSTASSPAVRDVSFAIHPGETVGIVGESGSGKSTAALALMDLVPPPGRDRARLVLVDWGASSGAAELRRLRGLRDHDDLPGPDDEPEPARAGRPPGRRGPRQAQGHEPARRRATRAAELFELVGIPSPRTRLDQFPHELSGGLRQRVMIASALAPEPRLLIADEPTTALDATIQAQILELIAELQQRARHRVLLITHDLGVVARVGDRVVVMYGGRVVEEAPVDELFEQPRHRYTQALLAAVPQSMRRATGSRPSRAARRGRHEQHRRAARSRRAATHARRGVQDDARRLEASETAGRYACWHPVGSAGMTAAQDAVPVQPPVPPPTGAEPLLEVDDLVVRFRVGGGRRRARRRGRELRPRRRRDARPGRRVRLRQVDDRASRSSSVTADVGPRVAFEGARHHRRARRRAAPAPARHADRLPGPVRLAEPAHAGRATSSPSR